MFNPISLDINFVNDPLLLLLLCFDMIFLMLVKLYEEGDEMLSAVSNNDLTHAVFTVNVRLSYEHEHYKHTVETQTGISVV